MSKDRLDKMLVARGLVETRAKARGMIMAGEVFVNGQMVDKAGTMVAEGDEIRLVDPLPYASRGGYKLAGALDQFGIAVAGATCADVGACTGGFTDVLLQRGAARVYSIDVGYGQLDWKLRQDPRVVVMERTNARHLESLASPVDFVCIDVSFISLRLVLPAVAGWLKPDGQVVALIKPQFEAGRGQVGKGGIVRDPAVHREVLENFLQFAIESGWSVHGLALSSIQGADGNIEFLCWLSRGIKQPEIDHHTAIQSLVPEPGASETTERNEAADQTETP